MHPLGKENLGTAGMSPVGRKSPRLLGGEAGSAHQSKNPSQLIEMRGVARDSTIGGQGWVEAAKPALESPKGRSWRDGQVAKSACYSFRGLGFDS